MGDVVQWEDPPAWRPGRRPQPFIPAEQIAEFRAHPKRWGRVASYDRPTSANLRRARFQKGCYAPVAPPQWECTSRRVDGGSVLYLRYVGEGAE